MPRIPRRKTCAKSTDWMRGTASSRWGGCGTGGGGVGVGGGASRSRAALDLYAGHVGAAYVLSRSVLINVIRDLSPSTSDLRPNC